MNEVELPPLSAFGKRVMVCGPSCSGKSTFATALAKRLDVPVIHLDQLRFVPRSNWVKRPDPEFDALHDEAVAGERWVIEGNYRQQVPLRLARATGILELITGSVPVRLWRYARRTLFEPDRPGALEGLRDSIKWDMIDWIARREPARRASYLALLRGSGLPMVEVNSLRELNALGAAWGLATPS
jgi:adenylate kinase family enzyme